jgi:cell division inhibitor SepF
MAGSLKKAAVWLGLVSDDDYTEAEPANDEVTEQVPTGREVEKARPAASTSATVTELESRRPARDQHRIADVSRIITVHPTWRTATPSVWSTSPPA